MPTKSRVSRQWDSLRSAIALMRSSSILLVARSWERPTTSGGTIGCRHALAEFCHRERTRLAREGALPRPVITISAIANDFERLVDSFLDAPLTPFCTRVRRGFVLRAPAAERDAAGPSPAVRNTILVIVPTRSRPEQSAHFAEAFLPRSARCDLLFVLDEDDPLLGAYPRVDGAFYQIHPGSGPVGALNRIAHAYKEWYDYLAFFGDDHRIRTLDWDRLLVEAIADLPMGIAYGRDVRQEGTQPSFALMSSSIVRELGYMAPPALTRDRMAHFWRELGNELGSLRYRDDVVVEHLQSNGRTEAVSETLARDAAAYDHYRGAQFQEDVRRLRRTLDAYWHPSGSVQWASATGS